MVRLLDLSCSHSILRKQTVSGVHILVVRGFWTVHFLRVGETYTTHGVRTRDDPGWSDPDEMDQRDGVRELV